MVIALKMLARFSFMNQWSFAEIVTISYTLSFLVSEMWWTAFFVFVGGLVGSTIGRCIAEDLR